uniref:Peptidase M16 N-terminal domain-containing protein n=1 Tax=Meloidogyne floridensis TaxID=298350 RepID=A0A915NQ93_9BILA
MKSESSNRIVTEASDDSGIPHMLEHCIFYDYVVDTNASTTQDSTSYYFDCANFTGFINAFKLFFEHLLSPLLEVIIQYYDMRINNYKTEVHSIGGEGLDIGVLYSEISGVERNFRRIVNNRTRKMLYGDSSVYSYNTGGLLNEIRIGCHVEKIIDFHNRYYHLDNLFVIISGEINNEIEIILDALSFEFRQLINDKAKDPEIYTYQRLVEELHYNTGDAFAFVKAAEGPDPCGGPLDGSVERRVNGWEEVDHYHDFTSDRDSWYGDQEFGITDDFIKPNEGLATEEAWATIIYKWNE